MSICRYFKVSGRVQGVGYRYFCYENAKKLMLKGYVKNLPDGNVETLVRGEEKNIETYYELLLKGPALSRVDNIYVDNNADVDYENFIIKY